MLPCISFKKLTQLLKIFPGLDVAWLKRTLVFIPQPYYTHRTTKLLGGYIGFTPSVRPSVRPFVPHSYPLCSAYSSEFWLDPFHIYTAYQATSEGVSHVKFIAKFEFLAFFKNL